jgi:NNP family nitrate/nitrite transporter-like MFS transporter
MTSRKTSFLATGHLPTLTAALLYFDVSFMTWVILGPLAPFLREDLGLSATEQGLLTAIPLLGGSLFRPIFGILGDRYGGRRAALVGMAVTLVPLFAGWQLARTAAHFYGVGLLLGVAGASFAVALPLATLLAPRIAERFGWPATFGFAMLPLMVVFALFALMAKDSPDRGPTPALRDYGAVLKEPDTWWLSLLYSLTFGGFVGLASFLTVFFHEQYGVSRVTAGDFTTLVVVAGSLLRPVGGWLSDKIGGYRMLVGLLAGFALCLAGVAAAPPVLVALAVLFVGMGLLGLGNGAVFQLVPHRFPGRIGLVTGIVGAAGGIGGFFLPAVLGLVKDSAGAYTDGLLLFAAAFLLGSLLLLELGIVWSRRWQPEAVTRARVFSYRGTLRTPSEDVA